MGYYWLNHRNEDESGYRDTEGEIYHYRSSVPGSKKFSEGDWFVYYRPGEHVLFGAGRVAEIEFLKETEERNDTIAAEVQPSVSATRVLTEYLAHMENYRPFDSPVSARRIKEDISFLQGKNGLSGVPQHSIYSIDREDYLTILRAAGEDDLLNY
jgi:hypothetical protein